MNYPSYDWIAVSKDFSKLDFTSIGKKGPIRKRVVFSKMELDGVYNLAFGDLDKNGEIDDITSSNNGDRDKVLATVAQIVSVYVMRYPDRWIYIVGSTESRTRLYRMAIGLHLSELCLDFYIYALNNEQWVQFARNMKVDAFLIKKKNL